MGRGDAAASTSKGTPRIRNKITHKTRLRLVHGDVHDAYNADDDHHDGKSLATGVDAEDANEYHLLQVLQSQHQASSSSSAVFCQQQPPSSRTPTTNTNNAPPPAKPPPPMYIPTPDATGKVANYVEYYPDIGWEPPTLLAKASETVEENQSDDVLGGGYAYVMDERDAEWLERHNKEASGESAPTPTKRSAKARGKEPETFPPTPISEDDFELVMGLFERFTEQESPYLHMSPSDVPPFTDYESLFSSPIPPHFFPSYVVPDAVPDTPILIRFARDIYPHWRDRKVERGGRRIIPQLNYDESNDSDPYVCFRRREVKPVRKTRRQDNSSMDRLLKLQEDLKRVMHLAEKVLDRESLKVACSRESRNVSEKRIKLVELRRKAGPLFWGVNDDELFVDRTPQKKAQKVDPSASNTIRLRPTRAGLENVVGPHGPPTTPADTFSIFHSRRNEVIQRIDRDVIKRRDPNFEDVTEGPLQAFTVPPSLKQFRVLDLASGDGQSSTETGTKSGRSGTVAMRLRRGRGGVIRVDRKLSSSRHPWESTRSKMGESYLAKPSVYPSSSNTSSDDDVDLAWRLESQWRYDADAGVVVGGAGFGGDLVGESDDNRMIIDDFEHNSFSLRKGLLTEEDFNMTLRTEDSHFVRAHEMRQLRREEDHVKAQKALVLAEQVRRETAARAPVQPVPGPPVNGQLPVSINGSPSAAMVAQIKKNQMRLANRPHPLATATAMGSPQVPQQASASPVSPNGVMPKAPTPIPASATPVQPSYPSTTAHLQPPAVPRHSQSPNIADSPASPETRPKSQPNGIPPAVNGQAPASISVPTATAFSSLPVPVQMQMRANGLMNLNGMNGIQLPANMMNGLTQQQQQAMMLKSLGAQFPPTMGNGGNIPLKLPAQRALQLAAASKEQVLPNSAGSPKLAGTGRASPATMNGIIPHHPTSSPSPRITHAPSPHQQTVGGPTPNHINGY